MTPSTAALYTFIEGGGGGGGGGGEGLAPKNGIVTLLAVLHIRVLFWVCD